MNLNARSVAIAVDPNSMLRSSRGQISCHFHVTLLGIPYPDANWSDSVVVVLQWWAEAIIALKRRQTESATLQFMEGSYALQIEAVAPDQLRVHAAQLPVGFLTPQEIVVPIDT